MIILNCKQGRMSNHKIMLAHVMAVALERGERWKVVGDPLFWRIEAATIGRVWNKCVRWMKEAHGSRNRCLRLPGLTIVHGWTELRDFEALKKHGDEIRRYFNPKLGAEPESRSRQGSVIVGLHKRRGDYSSWKGGIYYYDDFVYDRIMNEMRDCLKGKDVLFEVFSDENAKRSAEEDQHLMSQCDYIVGPPSTFSTWASFMGKVPLLHIMDKDQKVRLCDFRMQW